MMTRGALIIYGSARSDGHTKQAVRDIFPEGSDVPLVDLATKDISYFDYKHRNRGDDFLPLAERMLTYDPIILATPVYWYTMSAQMKTFLDRWSDLLSIRRDLRRALVGKKLFVIGSFGSDYPRAFKLVFQQTCDYLEMEFGGCYLRYSGPDEMLFQANLKRADLFRKQLSLDGLNR